MGTRIEQTDLARDALYTKVNQIASEKQDVLTAGDGIDITNGVISVENILTAGTGIDITNDVISVEGVKNQRDTSTAIKTWTGTLAQYNAIATKDNNTLYNITDDMQATTYEAYTKSEIDTLLNNKADKNLSNVEIPHLISFETDGTQWCKTYSNGWREQFCVSTNNVTLNSFTNAEFTWQLYKPITTFVSGHATVSGNAGIIPADVYSFGSTTEVKFWLHNALNNNVSNITITGRFYVEGWV